MVNRVCHHNDMKMSRRTISNMIFAHKYDPDPNRCSKLFKTVSIRPRCFTIYHEDLPSIATLTYWKNLQDQTKVSSQGEGFRIGPFIDMTSTSTIDNVDYSSYFIEPSTTEPRIKKLIRQEKFCFKCGSQELCSEDDLHPMFKIQ
jgi:hypothetical protein